MQASAAGYGKPYSYRGPEEAPYARNGGAPYAGIIAHGVTKRQLACVWPVWQIDPITLAGLYQHSTAAGILPVPRPANPKTPLVDRDMDQRGKPTYRVGDPRPQSGQGARALRFRAPKFRTISPRFMNLQVAAGP
jgi:hypothetical protein